MRKRRPASACHVAYTQYFSHIIIKGTCVFGTHRRSACEARMPLIRPSTTCCTIMAPLAALITEPTFGSHCVRSAKAIFQLSPGKCSFYVWFNKQIIGSTPSCLMVRVSGYLRQPEKFCRQLGECAAFSLANGVQPTMIEKTMTTFRQLEIVYLV